MLVCCAVLLLWQSMRTVCGLPVQTANEHFSVDQTAVSTYFAIAQKKKDRKRQNPGSWTLAINNNMMTARNYRWQKNGEMCSDVLARSASSLRKAAIFRRAGTQARGVLRYFMDFVPHSGRQCTWNSLEQFWYSWPGFNVKPAGLHEPGCRLIHVLLFLFWTAQAGDWRDEHESASISVVKSELSLSVCLTRENLCLV